MIGWDRIKEHISVSEEAVTLDGGIETENVELSDEVGLGFGIDNQIERSCPIHIHSDYH